MGEPTPLPGGPRRPATGGCLCGAVRYEVSGPLRDVVNCHCGRCRRTHGHVAAYTATDPEHLTLVEDRGLAWYRADERDRGFCRECGASLFWRAAGRGSVSIAAGTLDAPTGLRTIAHIFVADQGDYYRIEDDLERFPAGRGAGPEG